MSRSAPRSLIIVSMLRNVRSISLSRHKTSSFKRLKEIGAASCRFLQTIVRSLMHISALSEDCPILALFHWASVRNNDIGERLQCLPIPLAYC
jgi:hypothetical protein